MSAPEGGGEAGLGQEQPRHAALAHADALERLAAMLESGPAVPASLCCDESIDSHALHCPSDSEEAEIHRILRGQLGLAMRLLPSLREAADCLRTT